MAEIKDETLQRIHIINKIYGRTKRRSRILGIAGTSGLILAASGCLTWNHLRYDMDSSAFEHQTPAIEFIDAPEDFVGTGEDVFKLKFRNLRKCQVLLRKANNSPLKSPQHLEALEQLKNIHLSNGEFRSLAQRTRRNTAVGLARYSDSDLRFFLPPPPLPPDVNSRSITQLFKSILSQLPSDNEMIHPCIRQFTKAALMNYVPESDDDVIRDSDLSHEFHRESHHIYQIPRKKYNENVLTEYCLQALLSHSTIKSHCITLINDTYFLPTLHRIIRENSNNPKIKSLIGKIIANISLHPESHDGLFLSGFVGVLASWKRDPNLLITLPATKALCNLDQDFMEHVYEPGIYLLLPNEKQRNTANVDIVFLHGLLGGVFYSWRQGDPFNTRGWGSTELITDDNYSYCWPRDWLSKDLHDESLRVIGVDFDTYLSQWGAPCPNESFKTSLDDRSQEILSKLKKAGIGQRPVIFVGHSMGGLIIKKMLSEAAASGDDDDRLIVKNTKGIIFYGTPHSGSGVAKLNSTAKFLFFPSTEIRELEPNSPMLMNLHSNFLDLIKSFKIQIVSFGESLPTPYLGLDFNFVPTESSDPGIGEFFTVNSNHMNVCKPDHRNSILYKKLLFMIRKSQNELPQK